MARMTIRFPEALYQILKETAKRNGVSINGLVVMLLWEQIKK